MTVTRVEIQNIDPPRDLKQVMENQIKSERSRRSEVLRADGDRMHDVIISRGNVATVCFSLESSQAASAERGGPAHLDDFARAGRREGEVDGGGGGETVAGDRGEG